LARSVEGLLPCTPQGVISLLEDEGVELQGANAVVVGRSDLVGKPLAQLLLQRNATVTIAHSKTKDLAAVTRQAEVVIAAAGVPHLIGAEHISAGAVVIDVGIHRSAEGLIGDVDFDAVSKIASKITPVPGGVGPMTIAELLRNTLKAAQLQN
jgi:methylenetetrahydrofolate dehydrogenase (NADP+)/methenyltetrahydrofolate cyclohydrolase